MLPTTDLIISKPALYEQFVDLLNFDCPAPPTRRKEIKDNFNSEKITFIARKIFLFISAKASIALQFLQGIPFMAIVAPIMELGRSVDFLCDAIRDFKRLKELRESLRTGELNPELKGLCLSKLDQDKVANWENLMENIVFTSLAAIRVVVIAAIITATISASASGIALPLLLGVGIGMVAVTQLIKFGIDLYQRPNTTKEFFKGNTLKLQWHSGVVMSYRKHKLENERQQLLKKYIDTPIEELTFEDINTDIEAYLMRKNAVEDVKLRVKELKKGIRKAGEKDFALLQQRKRSNKENHAQLDLTPIGKDYIKGFSAEVYRQFNEDERNAFIQVFKINPEKVDSDKHKKKRLKVWFSGSSRNDMMDRLELGRRLATAA